MLISFFEGLHTMKQEEESKILHFPTVTIVVPVWNEEKTLAGTLTSLLNLDYPKEKLSIVVVDDGSTDSTLSIARTFEHEPQISVYSKENGGKHTAVNFALSICSSELFGCLDADSFVDTNTLSTIVKYFETPSVMAVTPCLKVKNPHTLLQKMQAVEYTMGVFLKRVFGNLNSIQVTPGPFSIFRKSVFDELGPYKKAHNTEDLEIALRMHRAHMKIVNSHKAFVYTQSPDTLRKLLKQRIRWTQGSIQNILDYRDLFFKREYGNFGMFILPIIFFFIFLTLFMSAYVLWQMGRSFTLWVEKIFLVGIHPSLWHFSLDSLYVSTQAIGFISLIFVIISLTLFTYGRKIAEEEVGFKQYIYFLLMYGLVVPLWVWRSVYNTITNTKNTWR